jgi:hypothetical protein
MLSPIDPPPTSKKKSFRDRVVQIVPLLAIGGGVVFCIAWAIFLGWMFTRVMSRLFS